MSRTHPRPAPLSEMEANSDELERIADEILGLTRQLGRPPNGQNFYSERRMRQDAKQEHEADINLERVDRNGKYHPEYAEQAY